ncbi:MAG TPA: hypothetical protein VIW26_09075 [Gemmatimonadales bacterium]|jgi:hypothetical protein
MSDPAFALHLGGGVYIDPDGNITHGAAPAPIVYEAEFKLPIDPKKIADALKSVSDALKTADSKEKGVDPEMLDKIREIYGFLVGDTQGFDASKLLSMLATVSKIAGTVAPVLLVVGFALDVVKMLGFLKGGPSALETLVTKRFDSLDQQFDAIADMIKINKLVDGRTAINNMAGDAVDYVNLLTNTHPTLPQLEALSIKLNGSIVTSRPSIQQLLDQQTWLALFDPAKHSQVWGLMQGVLFTLPHGAQPAHLPANKGNQFDHRLMVPLVLHGGAAFLAGLRASSPEYRSTGAFRSTLHDFAKAIATLAQTMRVEVLARTIYTPASFGVRLDVGEVIHNPFDQTPLGLAPECSRFPVGALDLRYHDNVFFADFFAKLFRAEVYGWQRTTKKANMDFRWLPPAKLAKAFNPFNGELDGYVITNRDECAAAANAQSEFDYAELLSVSGYVQLMQLATLFRNEQTDPDRSQTVQYQPPDLEQHPFSAGTVTVTRDFGALIGTTGRTISSPARREMRTCSATVTISTQPTERALPIEYVVQLRTLRSIWGADRWREPAYSAFQFVHYEPEPEEPSFMRMVVDQRDGELEASLLIAGHSPADGPRPAHNVARLKAHTFDWWIPVRSPYSPTVPVDQTARTLRGLGQVTATGGARVPRFAAATTPKPDPGARFAWGSPLALEEGTPRVVVLDGAQDWEGEHRDAREVDGDHKVTIAWSLVWNADSLVIKLQADPKDRNYVVYVVVEEKLQGGVGNVLHTAIPVPMNAMLTYVPQSFFDAEQAELKRAAYAAAEFARRFAKSAVVGPHEPIISWLRPGDLGTSAGVAKVLQLAHQFQPELLRQVLADAPPAPSKRGRDHLR